MLVKHAKVLARQWVLEEAGQVPGFGGAFSHGSTNWLPDDATLPATSDVDVLVVVADATPPPKLGKFSYRGVLLEVSYLPADQLQSPEQILGQSHLAGSFRSASILADPSGQLRTLQVAVARDYAKRHWVYQRCAHARDKILTHLQGVREGAAFHDQVISWLFGTGVTTHVLLVAGLQNPTVRRRYLAVRQLLADYQRLEVYPPLLDLLGCAQLSRRQAEQHLAALSDVFDAAQAVIKTPVVFAADISAAGRSAAIDGSRELIEQGCHREAIFWIAVTYARCQKVLAEDAPLELQARFQPGYHHLLGDLGITSFADLARRSQQVRDRLPWLWEVAEEILAANPAIEG